MYPLASINKEGDVLLPVVFRAIVPVPLDKPPMTNPPEVAYKSG
jgi:hypothetical protein